MKDTESKFAFSAANTFPLKVLLHQQLTNTISLHKLVVPVHVQLNPTNRCNFNCDCCSCSSRDRTLELSLNQIIEGMKTARNLGCQSITITGGGEPTLHKHFEEMVYELRKLGLQLGIVTNGSTLNRFDKSFFDNFVWVRISSTDHLERELKRNGLTLERWLDHIRFASYRSKVDWAFSHVVEKKVNYNLIETLVKFANKQQFSHIRLVNDILNAEQQSKMMGSIETELLYKHINDDLVNYQSRSSYTKGTSPCYISLLKPVINAEGKIFPCCGCQYSLEKPSRDYEESMCMGTINDLPTLIENQQFFDGSICKKCYYSSYNQILRFMLNGIKHAHFL